MSVDDRREELRRFLKERRARLRPPDVGLPATGRRRVPGLRREEVASLAGIGLSWYTALENGVADGVSETTLNAVADALRLSASERQYLLAVAGVKSDDERPAAPAPLVIATLQAIAFPAYIITAAWEVPACNDAFRRVWAIGDTELPFNAFARMFLDPEARAMHGSRFEENVTPVLAMLHSSLGRQPEETSLRDLGERIARDPELGPLWQAYEISSPLLSNACTIDSAIGTFRYETLTLPFAPAQGIVVQVPDAESAGRLRGQA